MLRVLQESITNHLFIRFLYIILCNCLILLIYGGCFGSILVAGLILLIRAFYVLIITGLVTAFIIALTIICVFKEYGIIFNNTIYLSINNYLYLFSIV